MIEEHVILVNEDDEQIGLMPKMEAHEKAILHRAFSVFIFNANNELMLQQRAAHKYHSPLLWTNTCCSHQRNGESNIEAGTRRLQEEMGFVTQLNETTSFIYKAPFANGLTEHELDHIMVGRFDNSPNINLEEVVSSISAKTSFIVAGLNMGPSKRSKADSLKVPIITEQQFLDML